MRDPNQEYKVLTGKKKKEMAKKVKKDPISPEEQAAFNKEMDKNLHKYDYKNKKQ